MVNKPIIVIGLIISLFLTLCIASFVYTKVRPTKIERSIQIDASASEVWNILSDTAKYPEWNPFIVSSAGDIRVGAQLNNTLRNQDSEMNFKPTVLVAEQNRELRWIGHFGFPGVVDGEHYFIIEENTPGKVIFTQGESFSGFLVPIAGTSLDVASSFDAMNTALKKRAE